MALSYIANVAKFKPEYRVIFLHYLLMTYGRPVAPILSLSCDFTTIIIIFDCFTSIILQRVL